ncbi:hypothetical protein [Micromonospora carbonacea]|uniref:Predicted pPIWI-associating nuclease domain-containing protein n=1 Tax=Micromonospora carbonacea TaxID=47853 RepID=A0A7H8XDG3_9ACTN|nr:hypothetical protein [Micromonospora carbonacea]MBB5829560.1 hypothetical protein [Micromonospora carbonacea]QLD23037.1 hypothetical protein HXZ27_01245 [Micromonospora carbonacea]
MVDDHNRKLTQAVTTYNREAAAYNREVKRAVDKHNREVPAHNARVRSNRQRLNAESARLNRQRSTTRYVTVQTSAIALHTAYSRVDEQSELWNERGQELADLAEAETANSVQVANALLTETVADADEMGGHADHRRVVRVVEGPAQPMGGRAVRVNPRNPDAARHFCTSAREIIVELINMKATDAAVLLTKPNCERGPDGKGGRTTGKIGYLLDLNGAGYEALDDFMETNVNDVMNLFSRLNKGTHGAAGRLDIPTLRTIKHRVEDSIRFLSTLVRGVQPTTQDVG